MIRSDGNPFGRIAATRRPPAASIGMETGNPNGRKKLSMAYKAVRTLSHFLLIMCRLGLHSPRRAVSKANGPSTALSSSTETTARTTGTVSKTSPRSVARKLQPAVLAAVSLAVLRPALLLPRLVPPPRLVPAARPRWARPVPTLARSTAPGSTVRTMIQTATTTNS
ncbi:hypothetical protein B0H14DRAFT_1364389 [Mycena olivaceomarginata]|nr:hypothetical protein B0H14DRAFT_1364389 [Mycena olivaceomarginata]